MPTYSATAKGYANLWAKARIAQGRDSEALSTAGKIIGNRKRYEYVANRIGQPQIWPLLGAIHSRESDLSFAGAFHNGDPIIGTGRTTTHVPAGRGPFSTWENSAVDAITMAGKEWHLIKDWPIMRWLFQAEAYNGWGNLARGINSSYLWAGTTLQQSGMWVADHVFDPKAMDKRLGVVAILKAVFHLDPSLDPGYSEPTPEPKPEPVPELTIDELLGRIIEAMQILREKLKEA